VLRDEYESSPQPHEIKTETSMAIDSCGWQRWYLLPETAKFLCTSEGRNGKLLGSKCSDRKCLSKKM
jgi:hypothetical protein